MGQEAMCTLREGRTRLAGKALLESDHLLFRTEGTRRRIAFGDITRVDAVDGVLEVRHAAGLTRLDLGTVAATWAEKIRNPRSLLDKMGIKAGMRVAVVGVDDAAFRAQLAARTAHVFDGRVPRAVDVIVYGAERARDLGRLAALRRALTPAGAIWVVHRKGKAATLKDVEVFAAAKAAGLVDNKVAAFSATHTAERLVIPLAKR